jgi:O-antigen ligase
VPLWSNSFFFTIITYLNYYGIDFIAGYYSALASRNLDALVRFFARVYLQLGGVEEWSTGTLRHAFSGLFIAFALLFRSVSPIIKEKFKSNFLLKIAEILLYSCAALIVTMSLSRTAALTFIMIFSLFISIEILSGKVKPHTIFSAILISLLYIIFSFVYYEYNIINAMVGMIFERFFVTKGYENRIDMYVEATDSINRYVLLGRGFGAESQEFGFQIHNFFLNAWFQLGIFGFLLATLLYSGLVIYWLQQIVRLIIRPHSWVIGIAPKPIMALPIFPLIKMLVGGSPFQTALEWFPFGLFFGFTFANERATRLRNLQARHTHVKERS